MALPLLQAQAVTRAWDGVPVLGGVDLTVPEGAHTLIFGPSGSGKTTLLHVLARLVPPDAGTLSWRGADYATMGEPRAFRLAHVGLVFQDFHLLESLTVRQTLEMVQLARTGPPRASLQELVGPLGLAARLDDRVNRLSRGERQRVALARAFANGPDLILADEPTASLDPSLRGQTLDHLFALCERLAATAIIVSHDRALAERSEFAAVLALEAGRLAPA